MGHPIFIGGTGSHAGKSWMTAAVCRWLKRRGVRVAPFKAQNMSLNSYPCVEGGEIGRAQVVQAEACGLEPSALMNPILLKPHSETGSQVVLHGKVWRHLEARDYYRQFDFLFAEVLAAFERLRSQFDVIVIEGAGSVSEINFRDTDLVNLGLAGRVGARALLVADIDRGGVFASVAGTFCVLRPEERELIRSFAINRFRGDVSLFQDGVGMLENKTGRKCLGVFPWLNDVRIAEEDSVALDEMRAGAGGFGNGVAILKFPLTSNLTDFELLQGADLIERPSARQYRAVILPGSKVTMKDLAWMRERGLEEWVLRQYANGAQVIGVCGGYQMMGQWIEDVHGVEGLAEERMEGLGLLPVRTALAAEKTTRVVEASTPAGASFHAYEIHMGVTDRPAGSEPFAMVNGQPEGIRTGRLVGTYLHGALENPAVLTELLGGPAPQARDKEASYERLADWFEQNADVRRFEELYL